MTDFTTYADGTPVTRSGGSNAAGFPERTVFRNVFDASKRNMAAADTVTALKIPARTRVEMVYYRVLTGEADQTMNVGDADSGTGYFTSANVATSGSTAVTSLALTEGGPNTITGFSNGKYYATGGDIILTVPSTKAWKTLKVEVVAVCTAFG